jgi:hypothetical protein
MDFMVEPMISGLLRAQVEILSKYISVLWLVNLIVITIMMTHARYVYLMFICDEVDANRRLRNIR